MCAPLQPAERIMEATQHSTPLVRKLESILVLSEGGKRQTFSFHIPGDTPDLQSLHLDVMDHSLSSLPACTAMFIPHEVIRDLTRRCPRIGDAFWRDTLIDGAVPGVDARPGSA